MSLFGLDNVKKSHRVVFKCHVLFNMLSKEKSTFFDEFKYSIQLLDRHDVTVEGGDYDVLDVVAVDVDQGGRCQHSLHLVRVDGHSLEKKISNINITVKAG